MSAAPEHSRAAIRIDDDVELLSEQIEALKRLAQQESVSQGEIYDFSIRWGTALAGRWPRLVHYGSLQLLDEADERRYQRLCAQLRELSNVIDQLGLVQPTFDETPSGSAKGVGMTRGVSWRRWFLRRG
jgi:hypothetical protein